MSIVCVNGETSMKICMFGNKAYFLCCLEEWAGNIKREKRKEKEKKDSEPFTP